jgi:hypothetical protein
VGTRSEKPNEESSFVTASRCLCSCQDDALVAKCANGGGYGLRLRVQAPTTCIPVPFPFKPFNKTLSLAGGFWQTVRL